MAHTVTGRDQRAMRPFATVGALSLAYEGLPPDLLERRTAQAEDATLELGQCSGRPLVNMGVVTDIEAARDIATSIGLVHPAAVVVFALGAIHSDLGLALLSETDAPVLIWALRDHETYPSHFSAASAVAGAGPVGAYALGNVLARASRRFRVEIGPTLSDGTLDWLTATSIAADLAEARCGLVGGAWPGMDDVHLDAERMARDLGVRWSDVVLPDPAQVEPLEAEALVALGMPRGAAGERVVTPEADIASRRLATALLATAREYDALAVRCHSGAVGSHPGYGVMGCLGASLATSHGIPVSCTGDQVTAVAMLLASWLGGGAFYVEVDGPDDRLGALLVSNGGELDLRIANPGSCELVAQQFFSGIRGRGLAFRGGITPGPATLMAFTELVDGWCLITLEGEILEDVLEDFPVPHAFFKPEDDDAADAYRRLGDAGAPHHAAITLGRHASVVAQLASLVSSLRHAQL